MRRRMMNEIVRPLYPFENGRHDFTDGFIEVKNGNYVTLKLGQLSIANLSHFKMNGHDSFFDYNRSAIDNKPIWFDLHKGDNCKLIINVHKLIKYAVHSRQEINFRNESAKKSSVFNTLLGLGENITERTLEDNQGLSCFFFYCDNFSKVEAELEVEFYVNGVRYI